MDNNEVKLHFLDYWRVVKVRAGLITLVFLLVMVTAGVVTYFLPREYLSKVTMEVKPDSSKAIDVFNTLNTRSYDPQFVATQFQILRKSEILYPVIEQLDLIKVYSGEGQRLPMQTVFRMLNGSLALQEVRNTGLIEIGVYHTDPEVAANIANTIAVEYKRRRMLDLQTGIDRSLAQFQDEVTKQRQVVEKAMVEAMQIRTKLGIHDPDPESLTSQAFNEDDIKLRSEEQNVNIQRTRVAEIRTQLQRISELKPEELMEALRTLGIEDQTVMKNLPLLQDAAAEEARLLAGGLGENHPRVRSLRAQKDVYSNILEGALEGIRRSQANKLLLSEQTLESLEKQAGEIKDFAMAQKGKASEYTEAKTKYLQAKRILEAAEMRLSTARMDKQIEIEPVKIWERAEKANNPSKPPVRTYLIMAAAVGLIIGVGLAFFIEYLDTSVKTLEDVERFLQIPVLAVVPKGIPILLKIGGEHPDAEAYRILRANIEFKKPAPDANTLTLISGGPGEGKSTTLNNLAFTCAKGGYNVLVVDADLRRPSQNTFFDDDNSFGLTDYLTGKATIDQITRTTKIDNLSFIPSGQLPTDSIGILNSQRMTDMIQKVKSQYDLVFFDSPPILGVSDGSVLASEVDMTIMVVQHRRFPRAMLQRVKQAVHQVGGSLIGVVLNNVDTRHDEGYSYYNAYQDYYATPRRNDRRSSGASSGGVRRPSPVAAGRAGDEEDY